MEAFRLRGGKISICGAIETKRYLFHIRHGPPRRIQWRGDVTLPARTRFSIVDKSPCLTPVQISRTKREIDFHPRETETKFRATDVSDTLNVVVKNCWYSPGEYSRWNSIHSISKRPRTRARRRSTFEDVYEIFNGLCADVYYSVSRVRRRRADLFNSRRRMCVTRGAIRELNNDFV